MTATQKNHRKIYRQWRYILYLTNTHTLTRKYIEKMNLYMWTKTNKFENHIHPTRTIRDEKKSIWNLFLVYYDDGLHIDLLIYRRIHPQDQIFFLYLPILYIIKSTYHIMYLCICVYECRPAKYIHIIINT